MPETIESSGLSGERLEILRLVENQTISAEEAARILEALDRSERIDRPFPPHRNTFPVPPIPPVNPQGPPAKSGSVRIRITDLTTNVAKINLVLPYRLVDSGIKMVKRLAPEQMSVLDGREIRRSMEEGFWGPLVDITDDKQRVEIIVEHGSPAPDSLRDDGPATRKIQ